MTELPHRRIHGLACLFATVSVWLAATAQFTHGQAEPVPAKAIPSKPPHPSLSIEDEWIFDFKDDKERRGNESRFTALVSSGSMGGVGDKKIIQEVIRWRLAQFTLKINRDAATTPPPVKEEKEKDKDNKKKDPPEKRGKPVHEIRQLILRDITQSSALNKPRQVRDEILKAIIAEIPPLFIKYDFVARLNGAILLAQLNETDDPEVPYADANKLLLKLAADETEHQAVRIWGVKGLVRMAAYEQMNPSIKMEIVRTMLGLLEGSNKKLTKDQKQELEWSWFNLRVVECLGYSNTLMVDQKPLVFKALAQTLYDEDEPLEVRAEAARSLSHLPLDGTVNVHAVVWETMQVLQSLSAKYAEGKSPSVARAKINALTLYLAFNHMNTQEQRRGYGFINQANKPALGGVKKVITEAKDLMLPHVTAILNGTALPKSTKLDEWVKNNPPKDFRIGPSLELLRADLAGNAR